MKAKNSALKQMVMLAITFSFLVALSGGISNVSARGVNPKGSTKSSTDDIVDTAVKAGSFTTLAKALQAAGLIDALKGDGPFTVFAPTDEAFAKLPAGTVTELLKPENKEKLKAILLYHVVPGKVNASQVMKLKGRSVKTLQGGMVSISTKDGVRIDNANVIKADIDASNGIIHVIDSVLMPPSSSAKQ